MIGKTVAHFAIKKKLGEGGMGVVYKAEDLKLKRTVALKFLPLELTRDREAKARFIKEAQAASALQHNNICTIHEIDETSDGQLFICMDHYQGETLKEKIARGPLDFNQAISLVTQAAAGLAKAHGVGMVHRDIKPANIMVTEDGVVKIVDFGLATLTGQTRMTKTGTTLGTVAYMSPEQGRGEPVDHRSDIWSLGVVLYEALTGRLPFKGEHEQAVIYSVLNEDPQPITALRTGLPMELERIVFKALSKNPKNRYQHFADMVVDLQAVTRRTAAGTAGMTNGKRSIKPRIVGAAAVLIVALGAVAVVFIQRGGDIRRRATPESGGQTVQSLAVLPFDNLMSDPEQDYFVDGMHDALITGLSKLSSLRVISRTSVMQFKDAQKPIPEIARELDVDVLVEGSVLRVGDQVKITAQLIDGSTDEHLWADSYDRDVRNVLTLLNEVAAAIADEINAVLTPEQEEQLAHSRPVDPDAYEAYLRGRQLFNTFRSDLVGESILYFDTAIEIDSLFAEAYAGLSGAYTVLCVMKIATEERISMARKTAKRALELNNNLPMAHTAMGYVLLYFDWNWEGARKAFLRALELDPNSGIARHGYADYLLAMDRLDESVHQVLLGRKSNPLSTLTNSVVVGHLFLARRYEEVLDEAGKLMAIDPNYPAVKTFVRYSHWQLGELDTSVELLRQQRWWSRPKNLAVLDSGLAESGPRGAMLAAAHHLIALSDSVVIDPISISDFFVMAGRFESALDYLEEAERNRSATLLHVVNHPLYEALRDLPRFKALMGRVGLQ